MGTLKTEEKKFLIIENFLPNLKEYLTEIYKITLYENKEYIEKFNYETWPGKRSNYLFDENKFLFFLITQNLNKVYFIKKYTLKLFLHLRRQEDSLKDWIHKDLDTDYAFLIYLNDTNLNSGTFLYDEEKNMIADIKYVKNRFVIYNGSYNHMGYGHFGESPENGRLTINGFLKVVE
jgi:hypothetical protein